MARMRVRQAVARALADEMEQDQSVIVFGEDVAQAGGLSKAAPAASREAMFQNVWTRTGVSVS